MSILCPPVATDLSPGDPLPDGDEVARYCSPQHYIDEYNAPSAMAFVRGKGIDISVNRLQSFLGQSRLGAVNCIRREVLGALTVRPKGRFVVVNVGEVKSTAWEKGSALRVIYSPDRGGPSHSSIIDLPDEYQEEVRVATAIMRLVTQHDIYPGLIEPSS